MPHITFIHGLSNKPPADTLIRLWADALKRDNPRPQLHKAGNPGLSLDDLGTTYSMVYWADVLYASPDTEVDTQESFEDERRQIESVSADEAGAAERRAVADESWRRELPPDEQQAVARLERQLRFEAEAAAAPTRRKGKPAAGKATAARERVPLPEFMKKPLMERLLRDLHHYFYNVTSSPRPGESYAVRTELQRRFLGALHQVPSASRPHIVVSHSMGTIIAYDCIRNSADCPPVDALITVGSPLGLDEVRDQVKAKGVASVDFPAAKLSGPWHNVYDPLDPVVGFAPRFAGAYLQAGKEVVRDVLEANWGWWRHNIAKYLAGPALRRLLREVLSQEVAVGLVPVRRAAPAAAERLESRAGAAAPSPAPSAADVKALSRTALSDLAQRFAQDGAPFDARSEEGPLTALADRLRSQRMYEDLLQLASAERLQQAFGDTPKLARLKAQALIERGMLAEAEAVLKPIAERPGNDPEQLEARGLLGRAAKQQYVNDVAAGRGDREPLRVAIDRYLNAYEKARDKPVWHGVNAVALLNRARRDGVRHKRASDAAPIAANIVKRLEASFAKDELGYWDLATLGESHLARGDLELAELWFRRAAEAKDIEPFALASTVRQLKEVWGLATTQGPGRRILPPLEQALAREAHTAVMAPEFMRESRTAQRETLEKVFGDAAFLSLDKMLLGLERCKAVGRVETTANEGFGTGFAIPRARLTGGSGTAGGFVFVTNAHVLSRDDPEALQPENAQVTFYALTGTGGKPFRTGLGKILKSSPPDALDYTVVELKRQPTKLEPYPVAPTLPSVTGTAQVFVIGHPRGGGMMFSLQDNKLLDHGAPSDPRVHYRAPTEPGSSGSPVFNSSWELIALHHAGSGSMAKIHGTGVYEANEGLWIKSITAHFKK